MVDRSNLDKNTIIMADRGYESYNVLAHIQEKGWKYIIIKMFIVNLQESKQKKFYPMWFRVVRFKITDDTYETVITNLDADAFSSEELKKLYHMRWGIETSFRELKYALGLISFHAKKVEYIIQEVFARLVMYNLCEMITLHVVVQQKPTKNEYQVNFTVAIHIYKKFFRDENVHPPEVEVLIRKNILPVREDRKNPRRIKFKKAGFNQDKRLEVYF
ncbi:MAG: transposase [Candidatus Cellulosilyticum pullistercoris]|uniref:Transposase n=1 Tax=Candidatus Cellulosilyticum pullistercoris TaxID=2838521 RepID=A0A9E2NLV5_9FIRM|nr:transposase [Candidatus Cellulosilyticum pullistercoris]